MPGVGLMVATTDIEDAVRRTVPAGAAGYRHETHHIHGHVLYLFGAPQFRMVEQYGPIKNPHREPNGRITWSMN